VGFLTIIEIISNIIQHLFRPYHPTEDALNHMGDYPDFGVVTYGHKGTSSSNNHLC
jgi:hypothetical protein